MTNQLSSYSCGQVTYDWPCYFVDFPFKFYEPRIRW